MRLRAAVVFLVQPVHVPDVNEEVRSLRIPLVSPADERATALSMSFIASIGFRELVCYGNIVRVKFIRTGERVSVPTLSLSWNSLRRGRAMRIRLTGLSLGTAVICGDAFRIPRCGTERMHS